MKKYLLIVFGLMGWNAFAQDSQEKIMEGRARELHRVLGLANTEDYKKFMRENYTKALLDKPVKMKKQVSDSDGNNESSSSSAMDNLDAKAQMYVQLHQDFGGSKIISINRIENKIEMKLRNDGGLTGIFSFTFENAKPYQIETIGIQAEMEN
jgi:hypothetical protein